MTIRHDLTGMRSGREGRREGGRECSNGSERECCRQDYGLVYSEEHDNNQPVLAVATLLALTSLNRLITFDSFCAASSPSSM